ncbi:hypothetical protein CCAX7_005820 [Capsulimonas corticalis]|uniref:Uncharacterized protein n=1 Tax=Capsulimonas corticalis TaxID=2219043 RepID=A0A402D381_9BACT|nr:hypothetical protein [Capsulimonas corticalis]BDI28531.1 hypothetical protein CCAX7_005820 [Capsulimonas corticalis]
MSFYAFNIAVKGPTQEEIASYLESLGEAGAVTPTENGTTVFSSDDCSEKNHIERLARAASQRFACPALAMHNYDDAILWYQLIVNGEQADEYDSCPSYFDFGFQDNPPRGPEGGNARLLCETWGAESLWIPLVESILRSHNVPGRDIPDFDAQMQSFLEGAPIHATFPPNMPSGMQSDILNRLSDLASSISKTPESYLGNPDSLFTRAVQMLPPAARDTFMAKFNNACIEAGVGEQAADSSLQSGFSDERERHAALAAALGLPRIVASLCGMQEEDLVPEGTIFVGEGQ